MKKAATLFLFAFLFSKAQSQEEIGFRTTDIGGEFQWYPSGSISSLHFAFNSRMHHSILLQLGYNKANSEKNGEKQGEEGEGWGGAIGYRYYFNPYPHKFFIGAKTGIWKMKIDWSQDIRTGETKTVTVQPVFEIGYTFVINDLAFITPSISNGFEFHAKTEGEKVGQGFVTLIGLSVGVRL